MIAPCRKGPALTKPVAAEMIRFLTDELARQSVTQSGLNSAQALLQCLPHVALPGELLSASLHLFQRLLLTPNLQVAAFVALLPTCHMNEMS